MTDKPTAKVTEEKTSALEPVDVLRNKSGQAGVMVRHNDTGMHVYITVDEYNNMLGTGAYTLLDQPATDPNGWPRRPKPNTTNRKKG